MKKRKIAITSMQRTIIVAALMDYGAIQSAEWINQQFEQADPTNDGPEVELLRDKQS